MSNNVTLKDELVMHLYENGITAARTVADVVWDFLGGLDPDCDRELIVWHLRDSRTRIAELSKMIAETLT